MKRPVLLFYVIFVFSFHGWVENIESLSSLSEYQGYVTVFKDGTTDSVEIKSYELRESKTVFSKEKEFRWEGEEALQMIEKQIASLSNPSEGVKIHLRVSESPDVRRLLEQKITDICDRYAISCLEVEVLSAYKQGFSWLKERVIPELKNKDIESITIRFAEEKDDFNKLKRFYTEPYRWQPHMNYLEIYDGVNLYIKRRSSRESRLTPRRRTTFVEETPELMDETAHGSWLEFLTDQGLAYLQAHINYLANSTHAIVRIEEESQDRIHIQFMRRRPGDREE